MIPFPTITAWSLVAAAATAAAAPGRYWWLALIPLTVAALGLLQRHRAAPKPPPPKLRVLLDLNIGSMTLENGREPGEQWRAQSPSESAWAAKYNVPPLSPGGWISGAGGPTLEATPPGWADAAQLERLERLASTSEMRAIQ